MSIVVSENVSASCLVKIQDLVKQYNWRFDACYPILSNRLEGDWHISLNSNGQDFKNVNHFLASLSRLKIDIKETTRKYSFSHKLKVYLKRIIENQFSLFKVCHK